MSLNLKHLAYSISIWKNKTFAFDSELKASLYRKKQSLNAVSNCLISITITTFGGDKASFKEGGEGTERYLQIGRIKLAMEL